MVDASKRSALPHNAPHAPAARHQPRMITTAVSSEAEKALSVHFQGRHLSASVVQAMITRWGPYNVSSDDSWPKLSREAFWGECRELSDSSEGPDRELLGYEEGNTFQTPVQVEDPVKF